MHERIFMEDPDTRNKYQKLLSCFIDILGTKSRTDFEDKYKIHKIFHSEVKQNEERQKNAPHVIYDRKLVSFSDCAYILFFYKPGIEETRKDDARFLFTALNNISLSIIKILHAGYFVRGGVSYGNAYFDDLGLFGPAIEEAYRIESIIANFPRIVVSEEIGLLLDVYESSIDMGEVLGQIFKTQPRLIFKQHGVYYLNCFYQLQRTGTFNLDGTEITLGDLKQIVINSANHQIQINGHDADIREKMEWILREVPAIETCLNEEYIDKSFSSTDFRTL